MNDLGICLEVVSRSRQPLRYIWRWISRKPLEIEAWFQRTTNDAKPLLRQLHWLPVWQRIQYKVAVLRRKVRTTGAPSQHLVQHVATRRTRSTALPLLTTPRTNTEFARRSYSYSAPFIWNSLPGDVLKLQFGTYFQETFKDISF